MKPVRILAWDAGAKSVNYERWLRGGGGDVAWMSPEQSKNAKPKDFQGLLLPGGGDLDPKRYGQPNRGSRGINPAREGREFEWANDFLERDRPVLGICLGIQVLNVALGGNLIQDLSSETETEEKEVHEGPGGSDSSHNIFVLPGTRLRQIVGVEAARVNSHHHQAIGEVGKDLRICALSEGQIVEGLEAAGERFVLGVQWHPERLPPDHVASRTILDAFLRACLE